jgi:hypothetical protein
MALTVPYGHEVLGALAPEDEIRIGKKGKPPRKPIDTELGELNWHVIKTQYAAFAVAKA